MNTIVSVSLIFFFRLQQQKQPPKKGVHNHGTEEALGSNSNNKQLNRYYAMSIALITPALAKCEILDL